MLGPATAMMAIGGIVYLTVLVTAFFHPRNSAIGYAPAQPVPYWARASAAAARVGPFSSMSS